MDLQIPLNKLKFGHEDGEGINARVTGRDDGIAALAANIHANGQIENLIVKEAGNGFYSVANGNRRLAAFHMIYTPESDHPIGCTLHEVDQAKAFEFSLATAITARQLHPVDQYEAFAKLKALGQSNEEIALHYGMTELEVEQALALGHLSPKVRELWRSGEIKTEVAQAFTMAADHAAQDKILDEYSKLNEGDLTDLDPSDIKSELRVGEDDSGKLVEFVGIDVYVGQGGKVTRDLFGTDHKVSDPKLAKKLAADRLASECKKLKDAGWGFAVTLESVKNTRYSYSRLKNEEKPTEKEARRLSELNAIFHDADSHYRDGVYRTETFAQLTGAEQRAYLEYHALVDAIELRGYGPKAMEKAGCFVGIDDDGLLKIEYGYIKPAAKAEAAKVEKTERKEQQKAAAKAAEKEGKPAPEPKVLSNALIQRLESQLVAATRDAIAGDPLLAESPFAEVMAKIICAQIVPDRSWGTPDAVRTKLPSLRQVLNAEVFNAAIAKRFDAKDYFESAPKGFTLKAIIEAVNDDEARKIAKRPRPEIAKFALGNVVKTGWLPKELRTVHYKGPGSEGYKRPATAATSAKAEGLGDDFPDPEVPSDFAKRKPVKPKGAAKKAAPKRAAKKTAKKKKR
jgi:ParB family chromosome partitioning protein